MKVNYANPVYDVVFKYMMEDERIARTILSALLKQDIIHVEMRPHEYTNDKNAALTMLRIDFGATVRQPDGKEQTVLIELQKTWVETETLRFRQYLGMQYENPRNMAADGRYALPMVAVYLLGHRVGDIEEPVLYVDHHATDYDERPVTRGLPNPFVESLTHRSIIVQIPLLHGKVHNRVEQVLQVFDQSHASSADYRVLTIDDGIYAGDADMQHILQRLIQAAADPEMRRRINIESEFMSALERRETEIMNRDYELARQKVTITEQKETITEQKETITEQKETISEQKETISEQKETIKEQTAQIEEQTVQMRKLIHMLRASHSPEEIAAQMGIDVEAVNRLSD